MSKHLPLFRKGTIFLPSILALTIVGFVIVKVASTQHQNIAVAGEKSYSPSKFIGPPQNWNIYENRTFGFTVKYPQKWKTEENTRSSLNVLTTFEASLGSKVKFTVSVLKTFRFDKQLEKIESGKNVFYILSDKKDFKAAIIEKDTIVYQIELEDKGYFKNSQEFKETFKLFLDNIQFASQIN